MRTIKFRGKRLDNGAWETGGVVPVNVGTSAEKWYISCKHTGSVSGDYRHGVLLTEVDPDTLGQFTGLFDKNGSEIYEGDISNHGDDIGEIVWLGHYAAFGLRIYSNDNPTVDTYPVPTYYNPEIIGNIHDNPELLKNE